VSAKIEISGEGSLITLEVHGYERPNAEDIEDANWLLCRVALKVGTFSGEFSTSFLTHELSAFLQAALAILENSEGTALLTHIEDSLRLEVGMDQSGRGKITGQAKVLDVSQTILSFVFNTDQTLLTKTCAGLEAALAQYPEKH
jgi:hypothetical protein